MGLADDVQKGIKDVLFPEWNTRNGQVVPETGDIALKDGAVQLEATYLYADMANSTGLAQSYKDWAVAKVIRCYLNAASRIIRDKGGKIRSFDGDRVMGIFIGDSKNSSAAIAALNISWAVSKVINPELKSKWPDFKWTMSHGVGIDSGDAFLVRGGVYGQNDIVSVGGAPNIAAKLSEVRDGHYTYISDRVYNSLSDDAKFANGSNMWLKQGVKSYGGSSVTYYGSSYYWEP